MLASEEGRRLQEAGEEGGVDEQLSQQIRILKKQYLKFHTSKWAKSLLFKQRTTQN